MFTFKFFCDGRRLDDGQDLLLGRQGKVPQFVKTKKCLAQPDEAWGLAQPGEAWKIRQTLILEIS